MKTRSTTRACRAWRDQLLSALDADRTGRGDAVSPALPAHLENCPGCASELAALRRTLARLAEQQPAEPPAEYWPTLRARVLHGLTAEAGRAPRWSSLLPRLAWGGLAAAGLLLLALAFLNDRRPEPLGGQSPRLAVERQALEDLGAALAASEADRELLLAEGQTLVAEEDPELLIEELTVAELAELAARLEGLSG